MKRTARVLLSLLGGLVLVVAITAAGLLATYPAEYLRRLAVYGRSDTYDYRIFPARAMEPAAQPVPFKSPSDPAASEAQVRAVFEQLPLFSEGFEKALEETHTQALIVIQDDTVLYERYFNGMTRDGIVTSFSSAKSFVSTLIGIAIGEGKIRSLDEPITTYLPELARQDPRFSQITIGHLVDMSSGIHYVENGFINGDDALTYYYPDLRHLALDMTRVDGRPGETWLYNNYHPLLLGLILERATGMHVADYLAQKLWQPMGAEFSASWSLDSDRTQFEKMESGINGRAIDFTKLGRLYLNDGRMPDGTQVVPADWVQAATHIDPMVDRSRYYPATMDALFGKVYHQRLWWGVQQDDGGRAFCARGRYGQCVCGWPEKRLIFVRFGETYGYTGSGYDWMELFAQFANKWTGLRTTEYG